MIIAAGPINIQRDTSTNPVTGRKTYVTSVALGVGLGVAEPVNKNESVPCKVSQRSR
jgi:hypothetical protein